MPSVLLVCTGNQFRSPLAAAFLKDFIRHGAAQGAQGEWRVESAGTWATTGMPAAGVTVQIAERLGLPGLEMHRTQPVSQELLDQFDLILVMETGHREGIVSEFPNVVGRIKLLGEVVDGVPYSIQDANGEGRGPEEVATELQALIQRGGQKILQLAKAVRRDRRSP
jgi:protein-tyrosine phosphatase